MRHHDSMPDILPFRGWRFQTRALGSVLCPPYDVISPALAARLRRRPRNAVGLELPAGTGAARWRGAARLWRKWAAQGVLGQDRDPSFYICEERFSSGGRILRRVGFLGALAARDRGIAEHERTLPKPKVERLALLRALRVQTSPIFGVFPDPGGRVRRLLRRAARGRPLSSGRTVEGAMVRLWGVHDPETNRVLREALRGRDILIADGHHRLAVSRLAGASAVLAYLCPEEDRGLVVLPTHRVVASRDALRPVPRLCRVTPCGSAAGMSSRLRRCRNPYAFGFWDGRFWLAEPRQRGACHSGLAVEWVERHLLAGQTREQVSYTPDIGEALARARQGGAAIFIKPPTVRGVRLAALRVGLLPPKTTYFYPKVPAGLAFLELDCSR